MTSSPQRPDEQAYARIDERWQARYRAARMELPEYAEHAPDHCVYTSNASGTWEVYGWDRASGRRWQATRRPKGTTDATIDPHGREIWWFADTDGDEFGVWHRQPFDAEPGASVEAVPGVPAAYPAGLVIGTDVVAIGTATDDGCAIYFAPRDGSVEPALIYSHAEDGGVGALSADGKLVAITHSEHGDSLHPDVRIVRPDGELVADLSDGPGKGLMPVDFSPVAGDDRLLVIHERDGRPEPLIWQPESNVVTEIKTGLDGDISADWYPDASALLISVEHHARTTLHRYDLASHEVTTVDTPAGMIDEATVRPNGDIEISWSCAAKAPRILVAGREEPLLTAGGAVAPDSVALTDTWIDGPGGPIHALWATPDGAEPGEGTRPYATVFFIHGGPHWLDSDTFMPSRAAFLDSGYAIVHVNYRGSTGYGSSWRDAITGRPGLTELEDIAAVHDWAVSVGLADPKRSVLAGRSWGGYLTLLGVGVQPERWAAGAAGVPVGDYVVAYREETEPLRAMDRILVGGTPEEIPERWAEVSPVTYADKVRAPVLITAGLNDPRCPIEQIDSYVNRLDELGTPYEQHRYDAGHGSVVIEEAIRLMAIELDFVRRHVPPQR